MKRRHEFSIGADPSSPNFHDARTRAADDGLDAKVTRQISKRRRVVGPDAWNGLARRNSTLQDINNISHRPDPVDSSNSFSISKCADNQLAQTKIPNHREQASVLSRPAVLRPTSEPRPPSLHVSTSERYDKPEDIQSFPVSPRRSHSGPGCVPQPDTLRSIRFNSPRSQLIPQGEPVRIKQLQGFQPAGTANRNEESSLDSGSGSEDEAETTDGEDDDPVEETSEDIAERELVESRYADINKMLGNLFLSRHRGQA